MAQSESKEEQHYGIGAVAKLTGLTDHTIRVWERRYEAVVAERAPNGRRIYRAADVEKLGFLKRLTDQGFSIGQIAGSSLEQLREQAKGVSELGSVEVPDQIGVAILGDNLPTQLSAHDRDLSPIDVRVADSNRDRFIADLGCQPADVVILESPILNAATTTQLTDHMKKCGAGRGIIVYTFGRKADIDLARRSDIVVLRGPVDVDQVHAAAIRLYTHATAEKAGPEKETHEDAAGWRFSGQVTPRRFNQQQLATLANTSTAIDCECPKHLAQLVSDLSAFEIYSANCASKDDDDAALHRYLHQTTAQARALIEVALEKVADAEGLSY